MRIGQKANKKFTKWRKLSMQIIHQNKRFFQGAWVVLMRAVKPCNNDGVFGLSVIYCDGKKNELMWTDVLS